MTCPNCDGEITGEGYMDIFSDFTFCCEDCARVYNEEHLDFEEYDDLDYLDPRDYDEDGEPKED